MRGLHPATSAIPSFVSGPSSIIARIRSCCETARFGAMIRADSIDETRDRCCSVPALPVGLHRSCGPSRTFPCGCTRTDLPTRIGLIFNLDSATPCKHILHSIVPYECRSSCRNVGRVRSDTRIDPRLQPAWVAAQATKKIPWLENKIGREHHVSVEYGLIRMVFIVKEASTSLRARINWLIAWSRQT